MPSKQLDSGRSPRLAQPATFMRLPHQTDLAGVDVALLGPREIRSQSSLIRPYSYFQNIMFELRCVIAKDGSRPMAQGSGA